MTEEERDCKIQRAGGKAGKIVVTEIAAMLPKLAKLSGRCPIRNAAIGTVIFSGSRLRSHLFTMPQPAPEL